jgi:formylglycine-generating enzyme required for sulfatase activity
MRVGKRLPTAAEWYTSAIGTPDTKEACNTHGGGVVVTGALPECRSATGVHDTVGNVWEWTSDDVIEGDYNGRTLPSEGYVTQVASDGVATVVGGKASEQFAADYIWSHAVGAYGILRGGFYGSQEDAGVYSLQAKTLPTDATVAIGFRCVL